MHLHRVRLRRTMMRGGRRQRNCNDRGTMRIWRKSKTNIWRRSREWDCIGKVSGVGYVLSLKILDHVKCIVILLITQGAMYMLFSKELSKTMLCGDLSSAVSDTGEGGGSFSTAYVGSPMSSCYKVSIHCSSFFFPISHEKKKKELDVQHG